MNNKAIKIKPLKLAAWIMGSALVSVFLTRFADKTIKTLSFPLGAILFVGIVGIIFFIVYLLLISMEN